MLYKILLFSVRHHHESARDLCVPLPLEPPSLSCPFRLIQSPCLSSLRHTASPHWLSILHMVSVHFHVTLSIHLTFSSPHVYKSVLCLFLHCCLVNKFISTIFLNQSQFLKIDMVKYFLHALYIYLICLCRYLSVCLSFGRAL